MIFLRDCSLSDHLPTRLEINIHESNKSSSYYKMNRAYLKDSNVVEQLKRIWTSSKPNMEFFGKLKRVVKFYKTMCKQRAYNYKEKETQLRTRIQSAQEALQAALVQGPRSSTLVGPSGQANNVASSSSNQRQTSPNPCVGRGSHSDRGPIPHLQTDA